MIGRILFGALISGLVHYYVWRRFVRAAELPPRWHRGITVAMILLWLSIPVTTQSRNAFPDFAATLGWVSYTWMALIALTFIALVFIDLGRLLVWLGRKALRKPTEVSLSRRQFLARATGGAALVVGGTSMA